MDLRTWAVQVWPTLQVTKKTLSNYQGAYRRNLDPDLGGIEIGKITTSSLLKSLDVLTPQNRYQTLMVARVLFREALRHALIIESPIQKLPSMQPTPEPTAFLTWENLRDIDFGSQTQRIRFLALHGLRYGEAAALAREDIRDGRVHVTKSVHGWTKSKAGVRAVPHLSEFQDFPRYQNTIAKKLKPYGVTVHSLRKTYAYMLKSADVHVTTASKLMGHSNPLITMKIYTAVLDNEIEKSGTALAKYMAK